MRTLYFDCFAGASGDMILGALLDAGLDREALVAELSKMKLPEFELSAERTVRSGIAATKATVKVPHEHEHRHLADILRLVADSELSEGVKSQASDIFSQLAVAEAKVHGITVEEVHFHEVGAMDSIIDIVGCCIGFQLLGIERFAASKLNVGSGFVEMDHGTFPVPPPAVAELLKGIPIYSDKVDGELVTPTGAAIISTLCDSYGMISEMKGEVVGYGAGSREYKSFPNTLRLIIGETASELDLERSLTHSDRLVTLETNIDDLSPQVAGFVMEQAFEQGALDCWFTPIYMKKNRPGFLLTILCSPEHEQRFTELLYRETSTLGIRRTEVKRRSLVRESVTVATKFGEVAMKIGYFGSEVVNAMPEYEDVKKIARRNDVPFAEVHEAAIEAWRISRGRTQATHA